jgi:phosphoribosylanthranilate isomerase
MTKIKICGLFREADIEYANEARPDYIGFVFAESRRKVSPVVASALRKKLAGCIVPVGVFVNAPAAEIAALYRDGVIRIAQLHGNEDLSYINSLREMTSANNSEPVQVIKTIKIGEAGIWNEEMGSKNLDFGIWDGSVDYLLVDSGNGTGKSFDWNVLKDFGTVNTPWFLAGGIGLHNIEEALRLKPFGIDVSSGAETDGVKDRRKMIQLVNAVRGIVI